MVKTLGDITQELNEKVLTPAKAEAEEIIRNAEEQAASIMAEAEAAAEKIRSDAKAEAENTLKQLHVDMDRAARDFIITVQEKLEEAVVIPVVNWEVREAMKDTAFLERIIEMLLEEFLKGGSREQQVEILLPEQAQAELEAWFNEKFRDKVDSRDLVVDFADGITFGFHVSAKRKGAYLNFSTGLVEAFGNFCSPRFREHFFAH